MSKGIALIFHKEEDGNLFEQILLVLKAGYSLVTATELEQLLLQKKSTANTCHITFDDGLLSFYTVVFPLLKKHKVPASLFVSPEVISSRKNFWFQETEGYDETILKSIVSSELGLPVTKLGGFSSQQVLKCLPLKRINNIIASYRQQTGSEEKSPLNMNTDQLRELDASGLVTIGAHTINHPVLKNENDQDCFDEIDRSVKGLAEMLHHPVRYFAYPNGRPVLDFGERETNYLHKAGISMAFSTELDNLAGTKNILSVPRMGFPRMGLSVTNPLIKFRIGLGKKWIDIRSIGKPTEKEIRENLKKIISI
ncbi:MAG: polysaccharide deacetylase family protein [Chitinophagales bacterium]|nr:polysaccharide deacetylase family protein [Chitinophagales bacterium]